MDEEIRTYKDKIGVDAEKVNIMIAALQKQTPMKPNCDKTWGDYSCPNCNISFFDEDIEQNMYYNFCPNCGQALDWGDD